MNCYLVLVSMAKPNKALAEKIVKNLRLVSSEAPAPVWFDAAYIGIPIATDSIAMEIWTVATADINESADLRDLLIVELGRDWMGRRDARATHWLASHLGSPRLV